MDKDKKIDYDKPIFLHTLDTFAMSRSKREEFVEEIAVMYNIKGMQVIIMDGDINDFKCVYSKDGIYSTNIYSLIKDLKSIEDVSEIDSVLKVHFRDEIVNDILN